MRKKIIIVSLIMILIEGWLIFTHKPKKEVRVINDTKPITISIEVEKRPVIVKKAVKKTNNAQNNQNTGQKQVSKQVGASQGTYKLTHYGYDCCKSGKTATGWDARTIWYNDDEYGSVRIVATSKAIPLYSIIKIHNYKLGGDMIAIVLDRGVGNGIIDILVENESIASKYGIQKGVKVEVLRNGK